MRKLLLTTAAVAAAIAGAVAGETDFGTFTDTRDGQTYKTVKIGEQTWMARNINYQTESGSWCYEDSISYCKKYGRLYDWNTALIACPAGYHLPSREEWDSLTATAGGKEVAGKTLKAKSGLYNRVWWYAYNHNSTDDYGFSALPGGRYYNDRFADTRSSGYWWTATEYSGTTEYDSGNAYFRSMSYNGDAVYENTPFKERGYSVRCVAAEISDNSDRLKLKSKTSDINRNGDNAIIKLGARKKDGKKCNSGSKYEKGEIYDHLSCICCHVHRSRARVQTVFNKNHIDLRRAYVKRLSEKPGLAGSVTVMFEIDGFGKVTFLQVMESTIDDIQIEKTFLSIMKNWDFGAVEDTDYVQEFTHRFVVAQ